MIIRFMYDPLQLVMDGCSLVFDSRHNLSIWIDCVSAISIISKIEVVPFNIEATLLSKVTKGQTLSLNSVFRYELWATFIR